MHCQNLPMMAIIVRHSRLSFLFVLLFFLSSCFSKQQAKKPTDFSFTDRWSTDKDATIALMSSQKRHRFDSQPELVRDVLKKSLEGRFYEFKDDGTIIFTISRNGKTNSFAGTWEYKADSSKLITTSEKGIPTRFTVSIESADKIILKNEKADERSMLDDWVLLRIKK